MIFCYQILVIGLKTTHFQFASHSLSSWWSDLGKKERKEGAGNEPNRAKIWVLRNFGKVGCFPKCLFFFLFCWFIWIFIILFGLPQEISTEVVVFFYERSNWIANTPLRFFYFWAIDYWPAVAYKSTRQSIITEIKIVVLKAAVLRKEPRLIACENTVKMTCIAITLKFIYHKRDCGIN